MTASTNHHRSDLAVESDRETEAGRVLEPATDDAWSPPAGAPADETDRLPPHPTADGRLSTTAIEPAPTDGATSTGEDHPRSVAPGTDRLAAAAIPTAAPIPPDDSRRHDTVPDHLVTAPIPRAPWADVEGPDDANAGIDQLAAAAIPTAPPIPPDDSRRHDTVPDHLVTAPIPRAPWIADTGTEADPFTDARRTVESDSAPTDTLSTTPIEPAPRSDEAEASSSDEHYGTTRVVLGVLGRAWLTFVLGALVVTLVPLLFGWRPHVVESGSMEPGIASGDVVLVSPEDDPAVLLGRVIAFERPDRPGTVTIHRAVGLDEDSFVTRGDANPTPDAATVEPDDVHGIGRLLVKWIGLPLLWVDRGAWLPLALFVASIAVAIVGVVRDDEDQHEHDDADADGTDGDDEHERRRRTGSVLRLPGRQIPRSTAPASPDPEAPTVEPARDEEPVSATRRRRGVRRLVAGTLLPAALLGVPSSAAASFTSATVNVANVWHASDVDYAAEVMSHGPFLYWRLDDAHRNEVVDSSGNGNHGRFWRSHSRFDELPDGALETDAPDRAIRMTRSDGCIVSGSRRSIAAPQVFTVVAWFRAPSSHRDGGKLIGFELPRTGVDAPGDGNYDRQLYLDGNGRLWFTVYDAGHIALASAASLNDGEWHMAVGTMDASGMRLYVDGALVADNGHTSAETTQGWWRAACGNLAGWGDQWTGPNNPSTDSSSPQNRPFVADLDELTVYMGTALTAADVAALYYAR